MVDFKSMTRKERAEYIWDYYKLHIIGGFLVLFFIISFIHGQVTKVDYVANLTILSAVGNEAKLTEAENTITSLVVKDGDKKKQAMIDTIPIVDVKNPEPQMLQKFMVKMAAREIDAIVLDKEMFDDLLRQSAFLKLDDVKEINLQNIKGTKVEGTSGDGSKGVYGISAEGNSILEGMGVNTKNKVIAIMSNTDRMDAAVTIFKWLVK